MPRALQCCAQAVAERSGNRRGLVQQFAEGRGERAMRTAFPHGARDDIERIDVAGAFPEHADMGIAHQPRVDPFLDIAIAAAHLHCAGRDRNVVAAGAKF